MENNYAKIRIDEIFLNSFELYFKNIWKLLHFFLWPTLASCFGIMISIIPAFVYRIFDIPFNPLSSVIFAIFTVSGLIMLCWGFWKYIVRGASCLVVANNLIKNNELMDFDIANKVIEKRTGSFVGLLLVQAFLALIPLAFLILLSALLFSGERVLVLFAIFIFFSLMLVYLYFMIRLMFSTAAFALNENYGIIDSFKKSFNLVKNNFFRTLGVYLILMVLLSAICSLASIPILTVVLMPIYYMLAPMLTALVVVYLYLNLEAKIN